jgi:hypothetical protein
MAQSEVVRQALEAVRAICDEPTANTPRERWANHGAAWPMESEIAVRRFDKPHARLFPFIGRKVRTPSGPATLMQVFADRVTVLLDSERDGACKHFLPAEIAPITSGG